MESHTHHKQEHNAEAVRNTDNLDPGLIASVAIANASTSSKHEMSPDSKKRYTVAMKRYAAYMDDARRIDDAQPEFTSTLENFISGSGLTAHAAVRAAQAAQN